MSRNGKTTNAAKSETNAGPPIPSVTKLCHIVKRPDFDGYGFNLHSEKIKPGQYIGKVDANSPAETAGIKEGDRIIEVNGVAIGSESHKQVVQRIKAISCEVRLLLIDVDGKGDNNNSSNISPNKACNNNNNNKEDTTISAAATYQGAMQEIPGTSANISSISVISTKRISNASNQSGSNTNSPCDNTSVDLDETDNAAFITPNEQELNGNMEIKTKTTQTNSDSLSDQTTKTLHNNNDKKLSTATDKTTLSTPSPPCNPVGTVPPPNANAINSIETLNSNGINKAGSLQLPMTAAEMRAKLMSKKKYDPKNECVDLKKKFEIIQKL